MFFKKKGLPEESDLIIGVVKKVLPHSVFVIFQEYENLEGMIHMSEVSPGRIRNIRDYVVEGKKLVCKVLRVDAQKRHIDLSLRRVSISQRNTKNELYKQEEKAEKILEIVAKNLKTDIKDVYEKVGYQIIENYGSLTKPFYDIVKGELDFLELKLPKKYIDELINVVKKKIKIPEVTISGILILRSEKEDGVNIIKKVLLNSQKFAAEKKYKIKLRYIGAPNYKLEIISSDFKSAEKIIKEVTENISKDMEKEGSISEFKR